jgi:uncharacterized protein (TIGR03086 family)
MLDLGPAAHEAIRVVEGVTDDRLADPTPCAGTSVAGLLDHFMGLALAFTWAARKNRPAEAGDGTPRADPAQLDPAWRTLLPERLHDLAEAWRDPAAWDGVALAGGVTMPSAVLGVVALDELVMHGWDLARATDQPFRCDPASAEAVLAFTTDAAKPENAAMRHGLFGPIVEVPDDAPSFERALGLAGRDPAWTPSR